jgi:hypothetical protein
MHLSLGVWQENPLAVSGGPFDAQKYPSQSAFVLHVEGTQRPVGVPHKQM